MRLILASSPPRARAQGSRVVPEGQPEMGFVLEPPLPSLSNQPWAPTPLSPSLCPAALPLAGMPGSQLCLKMFVQGSRVQPSSLRPGLCGSCGLLAFLPPCGPLCSSPCVWGEFQKQLARDVFGSEPPTVAAPERGCIATRFPEPGSLPKTLSPHVSPAILSASRPSRHPGIGLCAQA